MQGLLSPGARLGPYVLSQALGRGANATVYLARSETREVALKVRGRGDQELDRRFLREFEALRGLSVPGVVRVYDAGMDDAWLWFAMEVVRGIPIRTWIGDGTPVRGAPEDAPPDIPARVARLLHVGPLLCDALAEVHRAGLLHRDLKPSNVLVDADGRPHVLDFGVARTWADDEPLTGEGGLVGTLPFMSPEQVSGQPLTARSDMFAVGLMLYEGVAGRRPRVSKPADWLRVQCLERPRPLASTFVQVPIDVSAVVDQLVALDPRDRPDAATAAALLRACAEGRGPQEWPEAPAFIGSPPALDRAEHLLKGDGPRLLILAGPSGSGRRRAAEHVRRRALLAGMRTARGRCRVERPGGAVEELLDVLLEAPADPAWRKKVGGEDTGTLLEMWPHLALPPPDGPGYAATAQDVVQAASSALVRATGEGLLLVIEDLDEIDRFTGRVLDRLARIAPPQLAILCTVDDRHATRRAYRVVHELARLRLAAIAQLPDLDAASAVAVATAIVPPGITVTAGPGSPLAATEAGRASMAAQRGRTVPRLPAGAFASALEPRAMHVAGWEALGVDPDTLEAQGVLVRETPVRLRVASESIRASALARLVKRSTEARRLAAAWERDPGPERHAARARALLLAEDVAEAFAPAVHAALEAEKQGRYREARDWLVLVDALPRDRTSESYAGLRFALAACRASVAQAIGSERPRDDLVARAASRAEDEVQHAEATMLAAELTRRQGDPRGALVVLLKLASRMAGVPDVAVRALIRAADVRLELGSPEDAAVGLDRAEQLRGGWRGDIAQVQIDGLRADADIATGALAGAIDRCRRALRLATGLGYAPGMAGHSLRIGLASYFLGDRAAAESALEQARRLRVQTGERGAAAEAAAWLGWLLVGRGDAAAAHLLGEEALTVARRLNLRPLRGLALALALQVATARADEGKALRTLDEIARLDGTPALSEGPLAVAQIRWWRTQGEPDRALQVAVPTRGYFATEAALERARTLLERGDRAPARALVTRAGAEARGAGYRDLALYQRILEAGFTNPTNDGWEQLVSEASAATWVDLFLWILERDANRRARHGDYTGARRRLVELAARAQEHGHRPYERLAKETLEVG